MDVNDCLQETSWGRFTLKRYPEMRLDSLRAWDAADEYLLSYVAELLDDNIHDESLSRARVLVFDDQFGGLSTALLSRKDVTIISDSAVSRDSIYRNAIENGLDISYLHILTSLDEVEGHFDFIFYKVPKNLRYFKDMMFRILTHAESKSVIVGAAMVKYLPASALNLLAEMTHETHTSLAKKKARLIFSTPKQLSLNSDDVLQKVVLPDWNIQLSNHSNVFAGDKLDIGTRFMLDFIPSSEAALDIFDLACGSGVLGIVAAKQNPNARLCFSDDSTMAVVSAEANFKANVPDRMAEFRNMDVLNEIDSDRADIVLCNPPFHQQGSISKDIANRMFHESRRILRKNGRFIMVGNRHLNYHIALKRAFKKVEVLGSNRKFVVLQGSLGD